MLPNWPKKGLSSNLLIIDGVKQSSDNFDFGSKLLKKLMEKVIFK
jgi:hypothetical protein